VVFGWREKLYGLREAAGIQWVWMAIERILAVEDDVQLLRSLEIFLRSRRYDVVGVESIASAMDYLVREPFDLVLADVHLPDGSAVELLKWIQGRTVKPIVIMSSGVGTVDEAIECIKLGAFDYLIKPFSNQQLEIAIRKAAQFNHLISVTRYYSAREEEEYELLGSSQAMQELRTLIARVARTDATVLIQGETGTGKELIAHALHRLSPRAHGPFIKVNCAAIPENLIESEFFGHERGAFTGAVARKEGRFELAHGGTILLDEISEITPAVQVKLLRVLQEREFERVGGTRTIRVDVRVIATTNRRLEECVQRNEFRSDLFFRLNVVPIYVPPLRERKEDVLLLAEHFIKRYARKHGVRIFGLSEEAKAALLTHSWPGNVRELQNVIERAVILCDESGIIRPHHLGFVPTVELRTKSVALGQASVPGSSPPAAANEMDKKMPSSEENIPSLGELERRHILEVLARCQWNKTQAAKLLGISVRTLRNKLLEYKQAGFYQGSTDEQETDSQERGT